MRVCVGGGGWSKSIRRDFFPRKLMKHRRCAVVRRGVGYLHAHTWIFFRQQTPSLACSQHVIESVSAARVALLFSAKITERLEQRYCIKFFQKLGDSQVETIRKNLRVFVDDAIGITQIREWYNRLKEGRTSMESDARSGRPSTSRRPSCHRPRRRWG